MEFDDLIPLFVTEGRRRLETLIEVAPDILIDSAAVGQAKRELHTLKGSSRMLNQPQMAEMCHEGENLLQELNEQTQMGLIDLLDQMSQRLEALAAGQDPDAPPEAGAFQTSTEAQAPVDTPESSREDPAEHEPPSAQATSDDPPTGSRSTGASLPQLGVPQRKIQSDPPTDENPMAALEQQLGGGEKSEGEKGDGRRRVSIETGTFSKAMFQAALESVKPSEPDTSSHQALNTATGTGTEEHRISTEDADVLTGRAAAMRLLALATINANTRLGELAHLAESGSLDSEPEQVLAMLSSSLRQLHRDLESLDRRLLRHAEDQLDDLLTAQLQPLRPFLQSLGRHARGLGKKLGKDIRVEVLGGEARLDQKICSELHGAFVHLVSNAIDHGLESPKERADVGKSPIGHLRIVAEGHGDRVRISVQDDGGGIDASKVIARARESGIVDPHIDLSIQEAYQILFVTGFTTRRQVTEVSGRGVGLDAVGSVVRQLGGDIWVESEVGEGTSIFVEVPAARRGEKILVLRLGIERLAIPKTSVHQILTLDDEGLISTDSGPMVRWQGKLHRVVPLADLLGGREPNPRPVLLAVHAAGAERILAVDAVEGEAEVLMRPFSSAVRIPTLYAGLALLPTGEPVPVIAPQGLLGSAHQNSTTPLIARPQQRLRVLLVEDSIVTREMERRMLEEEGFLVTAAADAEEALSCLGQQVFDCMVTDLEMPGLSGIELTQRVRSMDRLSQLPVIVVSTRDTSADRLAGLEAGADAYLSKKLLEGRELAGIIRRLGGAE